MVRTQLTAQPPPSELLSEIRYFALRKARRYTLEYAEDFAQVVIQKILEGKLEISPERSWKPLVATVVRRMYIDQSRKDRRGPIQLADRLVLEAIPSQPDETDALPLSETVSILLQHLPSKKQKAIRLFLAEAEVSYIAQATGLSEPSIYRYVANFKTQLRLALLEHA